MQDLTQKSYYIPVNNQDKLHLKRIYQNENGKPVFLLHGSIEDGRIFYSNSGKGLAPFLARNGFDVFVADLRGRGKSTPKISKLSNFGHTESITEDIPCFINKVIELKGDAKQSWIAHSWGGVLLLSYFARFSEHRDLVSSMSFFATKRVISVFNLERLLKIDLLWIHLSKLLKKIYGYLPAKKLKFGSDNESRQTHKDTVIWLKPNSKWIDTKDSFDYGESILKANLPPIFYLTGILDKYLGHPIDVKNTMFETGNHNFSKAKFSVIGKKFNNKNDYDHINILTHPKANEDHFLNVLDWINKYNI